MKKKILTEALRSLLKRPSTRKYPYVKSVPPEGFRGRPQFDEAKCIGCGACAEICPSEAITITDNGAVRKLQLWYGRCTFCAKCQEICPEEGIELTKEFELATPDKKKEMSEIEVELALCEKCGRPIAPKLQLAKLDQVIKELGLELETLESFKRLCPLCRKEKELKGIFRLE
jgi:formate hydrogenlyase subunit 6/NADH:ubiquinone oxidoreductase subunit I